ncbi:MAG: AraC family transcriptional regulator [Verrucomicrobiota bacterium]|nr:AraC family transcriptional regulator [Verrucomicrobiota bacterium]
MSKSMGKVITGANVQPDITHLLGEELFAHNRRSRMMKLTGQLGFITSDFKAHGIDPDSKRDYRSTSFAINCVLRGRGVYIEENGTSHPLTPGSVFHRYPGVQHSSLLDATSDYAEWYLALDPVTWECLHKLGLLSVKPVLSVGLNTLLVEELISMADAVASPSTKLSSPALIIRLINFIEGIYERAKEATVEDHWGRIVREASLWLEDPQNDWVDIALFANEGGIAYPSFRRIFKERRGISPGEYRIRHRLDRACQMLLSRHVKEVADSLGYADPFSFSVQFKKYIGTSPQQFQRNVIQLRE